MSKQKKIQTGDGIHRRDFIKNSAIVGTGLMLPFGVPTLLRAAPRKIKIGSIQPDGPSGRHRPGAAQGQYHGGQTDQCRRRDQIPGRSAH